MVRCCVYSCLQGERIDCATAALDVTSCYPPQQQQQQHNAQQLLQQPSSQPLGLVAPCVGAPARYSPPQLAQLNNISFFNLVCNVCVAPPDATATTTAGY